MHHEQRLGSSIYLRIGLQDLHQYENGSVVDFYLVKYVIEPYMNRIDRSIKRRAIHVID